MLRLVCCVLAAGSLAAAALAQDFDRPIKGTVQVGVHNYTMTPDAIYVVRVSSKAARPSLEIRGDDVTPQLVFDPDAPADAPEERHCSPPRECKVEVRVHPNLDA